MSPSYDESRREAGDRPLDPEKLLKAAASESQAGASPGPWQPPSLDQLAAHFEEFDFVELIGRGGMGAVYRVVQRRLGRTVALKVLPPELAADPAFEERFLREARALAGLQHPRILTVHDFGERDGLFYLVTEFVEGMNLRQLMEMGELSPVEALRITPQICEALQFAHDHGVVHRDIKPENVLIDRKGDVKIADFGLARILGDTPGVTLTRSTQVLGTPHYMAPEQWRHGVPVDHRADIYAVGVVLYEMLTGQLPLGAFEPPSRRQGVPHGLDAVVRRSLAQQPDERYQRASEVGDDVRRQGKAAAAPAPAPAAPPSTARRQPRSGIPVGIPRRLTWSWIAVIVAFFTIAGLVLSWIAAADSARHEKAGRVHAREVFHAEAMRWAAEQGRSVDGRRQELFERYLDEHLVPDWERRRAEAEALSWPWDEPRPELPPEAGIDGPQQPTVARWFVTGPLMGLLSLGMAVFLMSSGFAGIRTIRARGAGTEGLGFAVFTAWVVPLAAVIAIPTVALAVNIRDGDTSMLASTITAMVLGIGGIVWMVWQYRHVAAPLR